MKVVSTRRLTDAPFLNLFESVWKSDSGTGKWIFASRNARPHEGPGRPDAVILVPVLRDPAGDRLVMIREFRVPLNDWHYGFPAGLIDGDESPESAAARELTEETGLVMDKVVRVSPPLFSSAGLTDESLVLVFADCRRPAELRRELGAAEAIEVQLLDHPSMCKLMDSQAKFDAKAWSILLMFRMLGALKVES